MKIPKYWAKEIYSLQDAQGRPVNVTCWRSSETSLEEAKQRAQAAAQQIAWKIANKQKLARYDYGERPLREEITRVVTNDRNQEIALVTRNAYGALVLNAARAMFIDIDFAQVEDPNPLLKLFGRAPTEAEGLVQHIERWAQRQPDLSLRIYRTFAGLRCLITSEVFDPGEASTLSILSDLKSDPLYVKLCRSQGCFRARLTPKPWRCGMGNPPARFPWENYDDEFTYRRWEAAYQQASAGYAACRLVKEIGHRPAHPEVAPLLALHDQIACPAPNLNLA